MTTDVRMSLVLGIPFSSTSGHCALPVDVLSLEDVGHGNRYKSWTLYTLVTRDMATVTLEMAAFSCYNVVWESDREDSHTARVCRPGAEWSRNSGEEDHADPFCSQ